MRGTRLKFNSSGYKYEIVPDIGTSKAILIFYQIHSSIGDSNERTSTYSKTSYPQHLNLTSFNSNGKRGWLSTSMVTEADFAVTAIISILTNL
jgi:hypothetical protein